MEGYFLPEKEYTMEYLSLLKWRTSSLLFYYVIFYKHGYYEVLIFRIQWLISNSINYLAHRTPCKHFQFGSSVLVYLEQNIQMNKSPASGHCLFHRLYLKDLQRNHTQPSRNRTGMMVRNSDKLGSKRKITMRIMISCNDKVLIYQQYIYMHV